MSDTTETETETNTNTDEPTKAELHDRVKQLESTVEKLMPSRRDAMRMGAAGIAGAAGLSATSQSVDASTGSAGQIGDPNNRPDLFAGTVDANNVAGARQGCRVFLSADQSITTNGDGIIEFNSKVYDSDNNFNTTTHAWTCPEDGLYLVNLQVAFKGGGANEDRRAIIGSETNRVVTGHGAFTLHGSTDSNDRLSATAINKHSSGDTIAGYARNDAQTATLQSGEQSPDTFLEVAFLGGL